MACVPCLPGSEPSSRWRATPMSDPEGDGSTTGALSNTTTVKLNNGTQMPLLGLGTWMAGRGKVGEAVQHALEAGYMHIDCASYHNNEAEIGEVLKRRWQRSAKPAREQLYITSKLWNDSHNPSRVRAAFEQSCRDLNVERLNLYIMQYPEAFPEGATEEDVAKGKVKLDKTSPLATWREMEKLVDERKVDSIGVSNFGISELQKLIKQARHKPVCNQIEVHPYHTNRKLVEFCKKHDIQVVAYSPLGSPGFLRDVDPGLEWVGQKREKSVPSLMENPDVHRIAGKRKKSPAQILVRWALQNGYSCIPKSVNSSRINENRDVFDFQLADEDMAILNGLNRNYRIVDPVWRKWPSDY